MKLFSYLRYWIVTTNHLAWDGYVGVELKVGDIAYFDNNQIFYTNYWQRAVTTLRAESFNMANFKSMSYFEYLDMLRTYTKDWLTPKRDLWFLGDRFNNEAR